MKLTLFFLVLIPLAFAAVIPVEEGEIDKRISVDDILGRIKNLDLSKGCVKACEENVTKFWTFLCSAACKMLFEKTSF